MGKIGQEHLLETYIQKHLHFLIKKGYIIINKTSRTLHEGERITLSSAKYNREIEFFWGLRNNNIFDSYWSIGISMLDKSELFFLSDYYSIRYRRPICMDMNGYEGITIYEKINSFFSVIGPIFRNDLKKLLFGYEWYDIPFLRGEPIDVSMIDIKSVYTGNSLFSFLQYKLNKYFENLFIYKEVAKKYLAKYFYSFKIDFIHSYQFIIQEYDGGYFLDKEFLPYKDLYTYSRFKDMYIDCFNCQNHIRLNQIITDSLRIDLVCKNEILHKANNDIFIHSLGNYFKLPFNFNNTFRYYRDSDKGYPSVYYFKCPKCGKQFLLCAYSYDYNLKDFIDINYYILGIYYVKLDEVNLMTELSKGNYKRYTLQNTFR